MEQQKKAEALDAEELMEHALVAQQLDARKQRVEKEEAAQLSVRLQTRERLVEEEERQQRALEQARKKPFNCETLNQ